MFCSGFVYSGFARLTATKKSPRRKLEIVFQSARPDFWLALTSIRRTMTRSNMDKQAAAAQLGPILTLWTWFETNRKKVTVVASIIAVVALIAAYVLWRQKEAVIQASEALTDTLVTSAFGRTPQPVTADKLLQFVTQHPDTAAGGRALFQAANTLFTDGKYAEAQAQFQKFVTENPDHPFLPQAMYGVAATLEAQGKPDEAAKAYKNLADRYKTSGVGLVATSAQARLLEAQGKLAEALPLFEEVARMDSSGMFGSDARIRATLIQLKLPPPAPSAPTATVPTLPESPGTNRP
jgi:TolA-binding protein